MPSPHTINFRHLRLVLGTAAFLSLLLLCLLWIVFHRRAWIEAIPDSSGRILRAVDAIYEARFRLAAPDTDGDGVVDWFENAIGSDPRNATSGPLVRVALEAPGVFIGERTRVRLRLHVGPYLRVRCPPHYRMIITAGRPILLAPGSPDDARTAGPLIIEAAADGRMEFDLLYLDGDTGSHPSMVSAANLDPLHPRDVVQISDDGWRLPMPPTRIETRIPDLPSTPYTIRDPILYVYPVFGPPPPMRHLVWDPVPGADGYVLEVARANAPDIWTSVRGVRHGKFPHVLLDHPTEPVGLRDYTGPLLYRIIPFRDTRP